MATDLMLCPICMQGEFEIDVHKRSWLYCGIEYRLKKCKNCGLVFASPLPDLETIRILYERDYDYSWFERWKVLKKIQAYHRVVRIKKYILPGSTILDVGCGHGYFVNALKKFGYESYGYDFSSNKNLVYGENNCYYGQDIDNLAIRNIDAITIWHTLEHHSLPNELLNKIHKKLRHRGLLFIAVPNYCSLGQKLRQDKWVWLHQPYVHIYHFNIKNINLLVQTSGFDVKRIWTSDRWDSSVYYMGVNSLLNKVKKFWNKNYNDWILVDQILSLFGAASSYLINPIHYFFDTGSEIMLIARKK